MIVSVNEMQKFGLDYIGSSARSLCIESQRSAFVSHYGMEATPMADQWEAVCGQTNQKYKLEDKEKSWNGIKAYLRAQYWLWNKPKNSVDFATHFREPIWKCERDQLWTWIKRISFLSREVIHWDERFDDPDGDAYIVSIDGVDFAAWEVKHPELSKDTKYCSHKYSRCAFRYLIAISIYDSSIVGIYGPYRGGYSEIEIFRAHVKNKVKEGKFVVADRGNKDKTASETDKAILALPNPVDNRDLKKFKARILARHETTNGRIKQYESMCGHWKHGMLKHDIALRAVAANVQWKMNHGSELFPVFVEGKLNEANEYDNIVSV